MFAVTLIASVLVSVPWNFATHRTLTIDWEMPVRSAILFGIVFTWIGIRGKREG